MLIQSTHDFSFLTCPCVRGSMLFLFMFTCMCQGVIVASVQVHLYVLGGQCCLCSCPCVCVRGWESMLPLFMSMCQRVNIASVQELLYVLGDQCCLCSCTCVCLREVNAASVHVHVHVLGGGDQCSLFSSPCVSGSMLSLFMYMCKCQGVSMLPLFM